MNPWIFCLFFLAAGTALGANSAKESHVYLGASMPSLYLTVSDRGAEEGAAASHSVLYEPRLPTIGVIGFSYQGISLSASHDIGGSSQAFVSYTDYSLSLLYAWFGFEATYTEFLRFRIKSSEGFSLPLRSEEYEKKDLALRFLSADAYLFPLRWNFDLGAAFDPSQAKTNGLGAGMIGSWNKTAIDTRSGLLPEAWKAAFGADGAFVRGELSGVSLELALAGSLALGPFYTSLLLAAGPGQHAFSYRSDATMRKGSGSQTIVRERLNLGLCGKNLFAALQVNSQAPSYALKYMTIAPARTEIGILAGYKW